MKPIFFLRNYKTPANNKQSCRWNKCMMVTVSIVSLSGEIVNVTRVMHPVRSASVLTHRIVLLVSKVQIFTLVGDDIWFDHNPRALCVWVCGCVGVCVCVCTWHLYRVFPGPGQLLCCTVSIWLLCKLCNSAVWGLLSKLWGLHRHQW